MDLEKVSRRDRDPKISEGPLVRINKADNHAGQSHYHYIDTMDAEDSVGDGSMVPVDFDIEERFDTQEEAEFMEDMIQTVMSL